MAKKVRAEWVIAGGKAGEVAHCTRCGTGLTLGGSQPIPIFVAASHAFVKLHLHCKEGEHIEPTPVSPLEWVNGRDTGTSSLTIWSVMTGEHSPHGRYDIPYDPADFGRCYRLLKLFPSWRNSLNAVAKTYPKWKPYVREWDKMTAMYEEGKASRLYDFMQTLRQP